MAIFVDPHCHIFNLDDVPIYTSIDSNLEHVNIIHKLFVNLGSGVIGLLGGMIPVIRKVISSNQEIVYSFNRSREANIKLLVEEISLPEVAGDYKKVITPLIMDFENLGDKSNVRAPQKLVLKQWKNLNDAILNTQDLLKAKNFYILPFIGFDLRKLQSVNNVKTYMNEFWKECNGLTKEERDKVLLPGEPRTIGIKLYPPISDNPYPDNSYKKKYGEFYQWCIDNRVPITVHCQKSSYRTTDSVKANSRTNPKNWERVLNDYEALRINFGHFGGTKEIDDAIDLFHTNDLDEDSWTATIVNLLDKYDNTYSDLGAFDYDNKRINSNLRKIIELDKENKIANNRHLYTKLLWGSDVPMISSDTEYEDDNENPGYHNYFKNFKNMVHKLKGYDKHEEKNFIDHLTNKNPMKFLDIKI